MCPPQGLWTLPFPARTGLMVGDETEPEEERGLLLSDAGVTKDAEESPTTRPRAKSNPKADLVDPWWRVLWSLTLLLIMGAVGLIYVLNVALLRWALQDLSGVTLAWREGSPPSLPQLPCGQFGEGGL
jgi:hypothetical protein